MFSLNAAAAFEIQQGATEGPAAEMRSPPEQEAGNHLTVTT